MAEQTEEKPQYTWQETLAVEHIVARPQFDELVEFAAEICLQAPARVQRHEARLAAEQKEPDANALLVRKLGLSGLRTAQDMSMHADQFTYRKADEERDSTLIYAESPLTHPQWFDLEVKPDVQRKIEAFGQSVLDEAFLCLGDGALDKARELKAMYDEVKASGEQIGDDHVKIKEVLALSNWLVKRIDDIKRVHEDTSEETFYHPGRLSPKFIGQFPDIYADPTCLGISVLSAAFAQKAGIPYMHGGVAESSSDDNRIIYSTAITKTAKHARNIGLTVPDEIAQKLDAMFREADDQIFEDRGYHAATLMELLPGVWVQVDPNYSSNIMYPLEEAKLVGEAYERLLEYGEIVPGMELMLDTRMLPICYLTELLYAQRVRARKQPEWVRNWLLERDDISFASLAETFVHQVYFGRSRSKNVSHIQDLVKESVSILEINEANLEADLNIDPELPYLEYRAQEIIKKYVFPDARNDSELKHAIDRCRRDPAYLQRRIEDLQLAPLLFRLKIMPDLFMASSTPPGLGACHPRMEVGLPAYRIGVSILSDFAVYCGDELPSSFWTTYWPSQVSLTEHVKLGGFAEQEAPIRNHIGATALSQLRYMKSYDIINWFLEQPTNEKKESGSE